MGKLFTYEEYQKRVNEVTIQDAIDYALHNTIGNTTDNKGKKPLNHVLQENVKAAQAVKKTAITV